jgi:ABC-type branched-subunit amino acid transport system substrate-binding protein
MDHLHMERQGMLGIRMDLRGAALAITTMFLAACAVVPKAPPPTAPVEVQPDENVLPSDDGRHRIALLVPLSGANGEVGKSIANATTMAILDTNAANLRITNYDTSTGAAEAARKAVKDGNKLILGPLMGDDTRAVLAAARPAGVPLISFTNDTGVASRDVFVMGHVPDQSIARTIAFARSKGSARFAALIPNGEYGARAESALSAAILRSGGSLSGVERYDRGNTSITEAARRLVARGGYDTVLIAEGARLSVLAAQTFAEAANKPRLLGTELWGGESRVTETAALSGAWFSAVADARYKRFSDSYKTRFGTAPFRISTLGYDAVLLTLKVARNWVPGKPFPTMELKDKGGFLGLDGPFRFGATGVGERAMEVREVRPGAITVVSPAPVRFED